MAESKIVVNPPSPSSPPPNCAICLGSCSNKCFSDSCSHEFCFKCLLEWSKIKAECPLCKQPFKSIIHNVNSSGEFEEHVVETTRSEEIHLIDNDDFLFLPLQHLPTRHEFHVRTTFTVDSRGEHAIQQMLLAHPFTNGRITVGTQYPSSRTIYPNRHRPRDYSSTFRRSIYSQNLWANTLPDLTGHYRDVSPAFFRNNPGSRQRLVPWLNRELNALLNENTQLVMHLADLIMDHLLRHHICSRTFRNILGTYLVTKTDHFVHEFYSFMRSPFDMVGYDRRVIYSSRPQSPAPFLEDDTVEIPDNSDDSDVVLVGTSQPPVTINLVDSESDSDEPIMITPANQVPMPIMPLKESPSPPPRRSVSVNLPAKLRHKNKTLQHKEKWRCLKKRHRCRSRSSSSSGSSSVEREKSSYRRYKRKKILKKIKLKKRSNINSSSDTEEVNVTSDTDDDKPLIDVIKKKWKVRERKDTKSVLSESKNMCSKMQNDGEYSSRTEPMDLSFNMPGCSKSLDHQHKTSSVAYSSSKNMHNLSDYLEQHTPPFECYNIERPQVTRKAENRCSESGSSTEECSTHLDSKSDLKVKQENAGPSAPVLLRRNQNSWYRVGVAETDSSD